MKLRTLHALLKTIVEDHKSDLTYFQGLETDFNAANEAKMPVFAVVSIENLLVQSNPGRPQQNWIISGFLADSLPVDRSVDAVETSKERTNEILKDIAFRLEDFGDEKDFTAEDLTERLDFNFLAGFSMIPFTDEKDFNATGWVFTVTLQESVDLDFCCVETRFESGPL